jgi:hypothetical protein
MSFLTCAFPTKISGIFVIRLLRRGLEIYN